MPFDLSILSGHNILLAFESSEPESRSFFPLFVTGVGIIIPDRIATYI